MKIGFDISQTAFVGGVAIYTNNLAYQLSCLSDLEMIYFYTSLRRPYKGILKNVKEYRMPPTVAEALFNRTRAVAIEKFIGEVDIYHSSDWMQPASRAKKVTTYHDVVPLKYPQWSHPKIVAVHKRRLQIVEREIDMVIAVSEATKKDLLEVSKIPEEKIKVIYEGVGPTFTQRSEEEVEKFKNKYKLPDEYILAIGGIGERRNMDRVKEASAEYSLVITGQDLPILSEDELPLLYSSAKVLLYPSFYEGFGLPIVEAMACGTPVITSNVSSMPEVAEEAAILVDPLDTDEIRNKLRSVFEDQSLRKQLIKKGFDQAAKFSVEKCANETAEVYKKLYSIKR